MTEPLPYFLTASHYLCVDNWRWFVVCAAQGTPTHVVELVNTMPTFDYDSPTREESQMLFYRTDDRGIVHRVAISLLAPSLEMRVCEDGEWVTEYRTGTFTAAPYNGPPL